MFKRQPRWFRWGIYLLLLFLFLDITLKFWHAFDYSKNDYNFTLAEIPSFFLNLPAQFLLPVLEKIYHLNQYIRGYIQGYIIIPILSIIIYFSLGAITGFLVSKKKKDETTPHKLKYLLWLLPIIVCLPIFYWFMFGPYQRNCNKIEIPWRKEMCSVGVIKFYNYLPFIHLRY